MVISNEPGYYADGKWGIRIENIIVVNIAETPNNFGGKGYLEFEHVTMVGLPLRPGTTVSFWNGMAKSLMVLLAVPNADEACAGRLAEPGREAMAE
jgi:hypothetical protein